jgi:5'-methylthioadenosine phosphorylase
MTNLTEAKLALEAEICYATVALCTDYDCWREAHEAVNIGEVIRVMNLNVEHCRDIIERAVRKIPETRDCRCPDAMKNSLITAPEKIPAKTKRDLKIIIGKYLT